VSARAANGATRAAAAPVAALPPGNIVLVGFMGSGKSEVGRVLAERTGRRLIDTDDVVVDDGVTIDDIFASEGEAGFRRREKKAVEKISRASSAVISTGGGTILDPANVKALKRSGVLVYLQTSADELVKRLRDDPRERPLLRSIEGPPGREGLRKRVETLLSKRTPLYESVADHVVACDGLQPGAVADEIVKRLHHGTGTAATAQRVKVALDPPYVVCVGRGILASAPELVKLPKGAEHACVISHPRIRRIWGAGLESSLRAAGLKVSWATFPAGEERKTFDTSARLLRAMARAGLHRGDVVFALGGGVVGDVGAFVASTYNRGIPVVQVPTTLLAMVDSSIGGKTGVNLPQGKNLVGTFHQPIGVVADLDVLATLPERELRGGLAEVVKYGFIADPPLVELVTRERDEIIGRGEVLEAIVVRCAKIKADVVAQDEKESGLRAILNYGHTLGHAIEAASVGGRGKRLHHGEAIAIGMVFAAVVARLNGTSKRDLVGDHVSAFEAAGLPTRVEGPSWSEVLDRMKLDKKYSRRPGPETENTCP
jgi:3-dehydroquinate synthase/shikimate kinase/3-dehydroquinate synthase